MPNFHVSDNNKIKSATGYDEQIKRFSKISMNN